MRGGTERHQPWWEVRSETRAHAKALHQAVECAEGQSGTKLGGKYEAKLCVLQRRGTRYQAVDCAEGHSSTSLGGKYEANLGLLQRCGLEVWLGGAELATATTLLFSDL